MPPGADRLMLVLEITGLFAFAPTVIDELGPMAVSEVVPCALLIDPLRTMLEFEVTATVLVLPPLNWMLIAFDALTVLVSVSVRCV